MAKEREVVLERCVRCTAPVEEGQKICVCGAATRFLSFEERSAYEVEMWRASREQPESA